MTSGNSDPNSLIECYFNLGLDYSEIPSFLLLVHGIDLVTVFDAILTSRQTREKLQCLYENLASNNFRKTAVLKKISIIN